MAQAIDSKAGSGDVVEDYDAISRVVQLFIQGEAKGDVAKLKEAAHPDARRRTRVSYSVARQGGPPGRRPPDASCRNTSAPRSPRPRRSRRPVHRQGALTSPCR